MANLAIGWPDRVQSATISGGSWSASLPASNVADRRITKPARSSDATAASTKIDLDFGSALSMQAFALINHNLSSTATWRIKVGTSAGATDVGDSGSLNVVQMSTSPDVLEWEDAGWWEGVGDGWVRNMHPVIYVHSAQLTARYVRIEITDTGNTDGYVQVGRVIICPVLVPAKNDDYGRNRGFDDLTQFDRGDAGAEFERLGRKAKVERIKLSWLTEEEARYLRGISRQRGVADDVLYVPDSTDMASAQEYGFLGRIESGLESIARPYTSSYSVSLVIRERL